MGCGCGYSASARRLIAGFCTAYLDDTWERNRNGAAAVCRAAFPVQLHFPALRLASARAGGPGGVTRLRRARYHALAIARRRRVGAQVQAGPAAVADQRLGLFGLRGES